jgi:hypothetical protein
VIIEELAARLGLDVDTSAFLKAGVLLEGLKLGFGAIAETARAAFTAVSDLVPSVAQAAQEASKAAQRTGTTAKAVQELGFAAEESGVTVEELQQALVRMSRSGFTAAEGGAQLTDGFRKLGVKLTDAHGTFRMTDEILGDVADKFAALPDGIRKTALAQQVFGRGGAALIPLLNKGKKGIAELREEAHDYGVVLDDETIQSGKEFILTQKRLAASLTGLKFAIGGPLLKGAGAFAKALANWIKLHRQQIAIPIVAFFTKLRTAAGEVAKSFDEVFLSGTDVAKVLGIITASLVVLKAASIASAVRAGAAWAIAFAPIAIIFGSLILALDLIDGMLSGQEPLLVGLGKAIHEYLDPILEPHIGDSKWEAVMRSITKTILDWTVVGTSAFYGHWFGVFKKIQDLWRQLLSILPGVTLPKGSEVRFGGDIPIGPAGAGFGSPGPIMGGGAASPFASAGFGPSSRGGASVNIAPTVNIHVPNTAASAQDIANAVGFQMQQMQNSWMQQTHEATRP